ncbi:galactosylceramide sulfotransferase-like [Boleophthalmus pectinirostris]|uniref:galactosylceramide sulfotransferase-like n=1 Tax=Boleophthalmus pectinirostris TaxID=150288 RepID=UPI00242D512F|nr:galactosylceramide sulfotransferase-like [Boleophthalmus pectinirostris]
MLRLKVNLKSVGVFCVLTATTVFYCFSSVHLQHSLKDFPVPSSCDPRQILPSPPISQNSSRCVPKVDIMFMKTHKTASSTIINILFRFGQKHGLKFAFPNSRNDFYYPSSFQRTYVEGYQSGICFNIMCNHMRFNSSEVTQVVPLDSVYFTVLRDPAELFESSFHYFSHIIPLTWWIGGKDKMTEFLRAPNLYYKPNGLYSFYLKNLLFFDFGYDNNLDEDSPIVEQSLKEIAERFDLVMLTEHFEESLILLKDALCWSMDEILFFKLNSRKESPVSRLTPELRQKALKWNSIDWKLYQYFNSTFWHKVELYGREQMAKDVAELKRRNAKMMEICIEGGHSVDASSIHNEDLQPWQPVGEKSIVGYNLKSNIDEQYEELCRKMLTPELQYMSDLGSNLWLTKLWGSVRKVIRW